MSLGMFDGSFPRTSARDFRNWHHRELIQQHKFSVEYGGRGPKSLISYGECGPPDFPKDPIEYALYQLQQGKRKYLELKVFTEGLGDVESDFDLVWDYREGILKEDIDSLFSPIARLFSSIFPSPSVIPETQREIAQLSESQNQALQRMAVVVGSFSSKLDQLDQLKTTAVPSKLEASVTEEQTEVRKTAAKTAQLHEQIVKLETCLSLMEEKIKALDDPQVQQNIILVSKGVSQVEKNNQKISSLSSQLDTLQKSTESELKKSESAEKEYLETTNKQQELLSEIKL